MSDISEKALRDIGKQIAALREQQNVSLRELEKRTGIYNSNISKVEKGKRNSSVKSLAKIVHALGCHLEIRQGELE